MSYCTFEYPYHDINNRLYNLLDNWSKAEIPGGQRQKIQGGQRMISVDQRIKGSRFSLERSFKL